MSAAIKPSRRSQAGHPHQTTSKRKIQTFTRRSSQNVNRRQRKVTSDHGTKQPHGKNVTALTLEISRLKKELADRESVLEQMDHLRLENERLRIENTNLKRERELFHDRLRQLNISIDLSTPNALDCAEPNPFQQEDPKTLFQSEEALLAKHETRELINHHSHASFPDFRKVVNDVPGHDYPVLQPSKGSETESSAPSSPKRSRRSTPRTPRTPRTPKKKKNKFAVYRVNGERLKIYDHFEPTQLLGKGAYAIVVEALDKRTDTSVAIKKNKNVFLSLTGAKRILREMMVLNHFDHPNIVRLLDVVVPPPMYRETFENVCMVFECMETTLSHVIDNADNLSEAHIQYLVYQMLLGLHHMHSAGVIHRDIKPDNILVNSDCTIKICDFGLARNVCREQESMTEYVVTRFFRAPELLCEAVEYGPQVDIWSLGCIMSQLFTRHVLFNGENSIGQLKLILEKIGKPRDLSWVKMAHVRHWIETTVADNPMPCDLASFVPEASLLGVDFFSKLIAVDPGERATAADILCHEWLVDFYDDEEILDCAEFHVPEGFETKLNSLFGVRHMMYEELKRISSSCRQKTA